MFKLIIIISKLIFELINKFIHLVTKLNSDLTKFCLFAKVILFIRKQSNELKKYYILWTIKVLCFAFLFFNSIQLTLNYLKFEFSYKLIVSDYNQEFQLPDISICTESNVIFGKEGNISKFISTLREFPQELE